MNRLFILAVVALACVAPRAASAHGRLKASSPAAGAHLGQLPRELRLDFSESPDLTFSSLRLVGPDGRDIPLGAPAFPADSHRSIVAPIAGPMTAGSYTVVWLMAGDDGHPVRGRFEFVIAPGASGAGAIPDRGPGTRDPGGPPNPVGTTMSPAHRDPVSIPEGNGFGADSLAYVLIRWLEFAALLLAIGAVSFRLLVLRSIRRDNPYMAQAGSAALVDAADDRAAWLGRAASGALAVTLVGRLAAQSYAMHGDDHAFDPALVTPMIVHTLWGRAFLLQLAGMALAGVGFHRARIRPPERRAVWWSVAATGAAVLSFSPGLASHASASARARALAVLADGLHVLSASGWLGTLSVMLLAGIMSTSADPPTRAAPFVRQLVRAFSPVALVSASIAAVTGTFAAWLHVGTIPNLWGTRYGITLLVKLAVLGVVALTGFYNWRFVQPRLGTEHASARLQRSATVEVCIALVVLLVTAVLVAVPTSMDQAT